MSYQQSLTKNQLNALYRWQQTSNYGLISNYLRERKLTKKQEDNLRKVIKQMNIVINTSPKINKNVIVYRGYPSYLINNGKNLTNRSFLATSTSLAHAKKFGNVTVEITAPRNLKRYVFQNNREGEVLFERGTKLTNVKKHPSKRNHYTARLEKNNTPIPKLCSNRPLNVYKWERTNSNNNSNFN